MTDFFLLQRVDVELFEGEHPSLVALSNSHCGIGEVIALPRVLFPPSYGIVLSFQP